MKHTTMTGTEKQIAWAEDLKNKFNATMVDTIERVNSRIEVEKVNAEERIKSGKPVRGLKRFTEMKSNLEMIVDTFNGNNTSIFWINNREKIETASTLAKCGLYSDIESLFNI